MCGFPLFLVARRSLGGCTAVHCVDKCSFLFRYFSLTGGTAMRGGYTLGFSTYFYLLHYVITIHKRYRRTDGRTDGWTDVMLVA